MALDNGIIDRTSHALWAKYTGGLSPIGLYLAALDWALHLGLSPGRQLALAEQWGSSCFQFLSYAMQSVQGVKADHCVEPEETDRRFKSPEWESWPFNLMYQGFLLQQHFMDHATSSIDGVSKQNERIVNFCARQALDMVSPSNFAPTNPEVLHKSVETCGQNFIQGMLNFLEDLSRYHAGKRPAGMEEFRVGETLATTPGRVIFQNELIELIQYEPATNLVHPEPVLIVPAWIMRYYVLDLSPHNSLVKYLVDAGFTVFMISWKNPDASYRDYGLEEYRELGLTAALDEAARTSAAGKVHMVGYCIGGTLLAIGAAALARNGDERIKTLTFLATQTDFNEPGELELFINESQLAFLDDMMQEAGVLEDHHMAATFQFLRSNDLIWSRWLHDYLIGERRPAFDLMAWNTDATRMPAKMHSEYLHKIFLENQLAQGGYIVGDRPIALSDIRVPIFSVGTERDHIAPWQSVYKLRLFADTEVTFLLTNGGHNAGIISEPGHRNRFYRVATCRPDDIYIDPESWFGETPAHEGSWWPVWNRWLKDRSSAPVHPPVIENNYAKAPGSYVYE